MENLIEALILGIVEGLTEFLPVSSTGHLLLLGHFLGFESNGKSFEVLVQLGAILAIMLVYFRRLLDIALRLPSDPQARRFVSACSSPSCRRRVIGALRAWLHQERAVQPGAGLRLADRRRAGADGGRRARTRGEARGRHDLPALDVSEDRAACSAWR